MKKNLFLLIMSLLFFGSSVIAQVQPGCDLFLNTNFDSDCLLDDYIERFPQLLELGSDECMLACRGNTVQYTAVCPNGIQYSWSILGAQNYTLINQNRTAVVTWGTGNVGNISVSVLTSDSITCSTETCVILMESPVAACSSVPLYYYDQSGNKVIEICFGETIDFTDMSNARRTPITGYLWESDFGAASSQNYSLTPSQEGEFKLSHCVWNECGCSNCETIIIKVLPKVELELSCHGTVCQNSTATYTVTSPSCSEYIWSVEGGSFSGQGSPTITVDWGRPSSGYGVISLDSYFCDTECKSLLSVKVPVIVNRAEIVGPDEVCVGDIQQYELPMWGSTLYQWWITPNYNNEIIEHNAEYPNQYLLEFTRPGTYTIKASYVCDFLECGPFNTQKTIVVKDTMSIRSTDSVVCKGDTGHYSTWHGNNMSWKVYNQNNQYVFGTSGISLDYSFLIPGKYRIVASNTADYCKDAEFFVTVLDNPPPLTFVQGPNQTCPGNSILLSATPTQPNYFLQWQPLCTTATPSSVDGEEVTINYHAEVCDVAVYQVDNEYGCRSEAYIHTVDTFLLAPFTEPSITHVCAGASVFMGVADQSTNVTYEWTISPANAASVVGSHFSPNVQILTNHLDNLPVVATVTLKRTYCTNIEEYVTAQISIENATVTVDYEDTICDNMKEYFYASGTQNYNDYTWIMDSTDVLHGYNPNYFFGTPGTHYFTLTYQPDPRCDAVTVNGQVVVVGSPSVSIIATNDTILSVAQQANVTYSWTFNGDTIPNMHDTVCFVRDTGEYCCIVTSTIPPYCVAMSCFSNKPIGSFPQDTCLTLALSNTLISCTEAVIKASNPTNATISWGISPQYGYCSPLSSTDSTTVYFSKIGPNHISAYMVDNGQCYRGGINVTLDCVPGLKVRYDCDGHLIVYDTSKYRDGFAMPNRTITIDGTSYSATLTDTNRITSIPIAGLPHGQYTVTMDMGMGVPCSVSGDFIFEGNPIIDSIMINHKMCENTPFQFNANTSGTIVRYRWDFGDGSRNTGNGIYHTYSFNYNEDRTVVLTVTDSWGCTATDTAHVNIGQNLLTGTLDAANSIPVCPGQNRVIIFDPDDYVNDYYWNHSPYPTSENHYNTTSTGDYYLYIETSDYGCRAERICNVGFLNAPTARITGNTEYCLGELVKLNGNTGNSNTYLWYVWDQDNTCVYTSTSSIIRFTPDAAGNYTVMLNVTSPDNCSAQAVYHFVVHPRPGAPKIVISGCIHEPPVRAICVTGQSLLWSNGFNGTQSDYYTDGYMSAYYIETTTGCPSEKAFEYIIPAPNYDALLTGCYEICPDSLWTKLPVYGFYPYYPSQMQWFWKYFGQGIIDQGTDLNPLLSLNGYGTYQMITEYGDGCEIKSPELQIENREYCPCEGIDLKPEKTYCYVEDCKMYYHLSYIVTNQGPNMVKFSHLQVSPSGNLVSVTGLPMTIPAGGSQFFEFDVVVTEFMNGTLHFSLIDPETGCEKQYSETLLFDACMDGECIIEEYSFDFNSELSIPHHTSSFQFFFNVPGAIQLVSMWSVPPQIVNYTSSAALDINGLMKFDYARLSQMAAHDELVCFHVVVCLEEERLCHAELCIYAKQFMEMIPEEFRRFSDSTMADNDSTRSFRFNMDVLQAGKPYLAPNPARDEVTVMGIAPENVAGITVFTMQGGQVADYRNDYRFNVSRLSKAVYIVRVITTDRKVHYLKLVKQ